MFRLATVAAITSLALSGCTLTGDNDDDKDTADPSGCLLSALGLC